MELFRKLYRLLFAWDIPTASDAEMKMADAFVTQSHSPMKYGDAGPGNRILAKAARELQNKYGLPLLIQEEIKIADPNIQYDHISQDPSLTGRSTGTWNTYEVAKKQKEFCDKKGWKRIIVVAHPDHMLRSILVYKKLGLNAVGAPMPMNRKRYSYPGSTQYGLVGFRIREMLARLLFWYWGYI